MPSVVIPAHNEKAVIERCLRSVLAEPRIEGLEVVVVCNGCSDETAQICRDFDESIVVIETEVPLVRLPSGHICIDLLQVPVRGWRVPAET